MEEFGLLTGKIISESEVSFKWRVLQSFMNESQTYSSIDFGSVYENFSDCYLELEKMYGPYSFSLICSDDFLSKFENISLEVIIEIFNDNQFETRYLKQYPSLNSENRKLFILSNHQFYPETSEIVFNLKFRGISTTLTASCPIQTSDITNVENLETSEEKKNSSFQNHKALIHDMIDLYIKSDMSDMTVHVEDEVLPVHKLILSARSSVLKNMIESESEESNTDCIDITGSDKEVFKTFLLYLYSGELEYNSLDTVLSLYTMADKYNVLSLQESCSQILQSKFDSDGVESMADYVCQILELAFKHDDNMLKNFATKFIVRHFAVVGKMQSWKDLLNNNATITSHILVEIVTAQQEAKN